MDEQFPFEIALYRGSVGGEGAMVALDGDVLLVDSGFGFCGREMVDDLKRVLRGRTPKTLLLTHSHYDHALGSVYIRDAFPDIEIVGSERCAAVFASENARRTMRGLDEAAAKGFGKAPDADRTGELRLDRTLAEGDALTLGDKTLRVLALPGHTRCCIGAYDAEDRFLITCETTGTWGSPTSVNPGYVSSCVQTLATLERVLALAPRDMLVSHYGPVYGEENVRLFLTRSRDACVARRDLILAMTREGLSDEEITRRIAEDYFSPEIAAYYPIQAFLTNTYAQIGMIRREYASAGQEGASA